ncbi:TetR/AcrR family transcriptional regulator [Microbacterium sp. RURRCA19A]|uniref:TetR/AcrR family transcriptional regulator n=1 Tax=Microbacterium sp. RURRCA19A TaxID=1907391 RepID=UPI000956C9EA|nr:TetR/AcrR family transcriptional regulator [Microbacterium sp. RURRCA19A]SIR81033.1 transcriptional regulator, TetR family [Microbacterium sp. RURRCA19A]
MTEEIRTRRKRGSITRAEIVDAALRLMDGEGESALTFSRLGAELKSSPTAVYRHFTSRDELLAALADHLDGISLAGYEPTDDWRADLTDLAWRAWRTAEAHPAAAALTLLTVANSINELRAVEWILRAMDRAGLRGRAAVVQYQVYAQTVLGAASAYGARLISAGSREVADGWIQVYAPTDPSQYPHAEAAKADLAMMNYREVFAMQLEMYLSALELTVARTV